MANGLRAGVNMAKALRRTRVDANHSPAHTTKSVTTGIIPNNGSSLKTGPARPGHVKIAVDITAVDINLFFLYSTGTMIMYDSFSL